MNGSLLMPIEVAYCVLLLSAPKLRQRLNYRSLLALSKTLGRRIGRSQTSHDLPMPRPAPIERPQSPLTE
jgi:hypothetical protein